MSKRLDLARQRFSRWLVLEYSHTTKRGRSCWKCICNPDFGGCGTIKTVFGENLKSGATQSCGCYMREEASTRGKLRSGKNHPFYGKKRPEHSKKMKDKKRPDLANRNKLKIGKLNHNYNPKLTDEEREIRRTYPEYRVWRKAVFERDNWTCQVCGKHGGNLVAHHLESYHNNPKLRTTLSNGATTCDKCHGNFHYQYGRINNTKEQFIKFMEENL